jgi:anthranilate phosphoribosyltransferase
MSVPSPPTPPKEPEKVSITPLLKRLAYPSVENIEASAEEIASAFSLIFENRISVVQCASLLSLLHSTGKDREPDVIAKCAERMREAAAPISATELRAIIRKRGRKEGSYRGGLVSPQTRKASAFSPPTPVTNNPVRHRRHRRRLP